MRILHSDAAAFSWIVLCYRPFAVCNMADQIGTNLTVETIMRRTGGHRSRAGSARHSGGHAACAARRGGTALESSIRAFLDGLTHGEGLLHALYDQVLDEPVPQGLRNLFKEPEECGLPGSAVL